MICCPRGRGGGIHDNTNREPRKLGDAVPTAECVPIPPEEGNARPTPCGRHRPNPDDGRGPLAPVRPHHASLCSSVSSSSIMSLVSLSSILASVVAPLVVASVTVSTATTSKDASVSVVLQMEVDSGCGDSNNGTSANTHNG
jgi:hypothetical protein